MDKTGEDKEICPQLNLLIDVCDILSPFRVKSVKPIIICGPFCTIINNAGFGNSG
jgi:hypothetical protein